MNGAWTRGVIGAVLLPAVCLLTGCRGIGRDSGPPPFDPLYGTAPAAPSDDYVYRAPSRNNNAPLPTVADPAVPGSLAALAPRRDIKDSSKLRISTTSNDVRPTATDTWRDAGGAGATLRRPQPLSEKTTARVVTPEPIRRAGGLATQVVTVEQGIELLEQRGAIGTRLDRVSGDKPWRFSTSIPHPDNRRARQTHIGTAADPLSAVRAVLDKIEQDERQLSQ